MGTKESISISEIEKWTGPSRDSRILWQRCRNSKENSGSDRVRSSTNRMGLWTFSQILIWDQVHLVTDHQSFECLYSKKSRSPARIERCVLRRQVFDYIIEYKPGSENIVDSLSRLSRCCWEENEERCRRICTVYSPDSRFDWKSWQPEKQRNIPAVMLNWVK